MAKRKELQQVSLSPCLELAAMFWAKYLELVIATSEVIDITRVVLSVAVRVVQF